MRRSLFFARFVTALVLAIGLLPLQTAHAANPPGPGDVLVNEYVANSSVTEWVELYNTTAAELDISGHYIDDIAGGGGAPKIIPDNTLIPAGGYYVMEFAGFLNNGGDDVRFLDPTQSVVLDSTSYTSATAEYSWYRSPDGGAWSPTESSAPTKGSANPSGGPPAPALGEVLINEFVANSATEWVELYNTTSSDLDLSGHYIDDVVAGGGAPQEILGGTIIPAGGFFVMEVSSYFNNGGDDVRFLDPAQAELDATSYTFATSEYSWYRSPDGGAWSLDETDRPTKGAFNTPAPIPGEVLINEFVANSATEWVELYNTTIYPRNLSDHYIDDIAGGGGSPMQIPDGTVIQANGFYVMEFSSYLNNGGDDVRFLDPTQSVVLDTKSYTSTTAEYSWYRYPDGGAWSGVESASPSKGSSNPGTGDETWTPGTFEIRIFDIEQGDSQLIIFPSGFSVLIDVREPSWNTGSGAAFIAAKIRAVTGGSHVDVGVLSHHHLDHIGYAGFGGFWGLIENEGITFGQVIDRDAGVWVDGSGGGASDGLCDPSLEIVWHNAGTQSGTSRNWLCYATNPGNTNIYPIRQIAQLGSTTQIDPPDPNAVVEIVQVDGDGVMMVDGVTPIQGDHTGDAVPPSENDYSIGLKIRYGQIDYATAGDSDGEYATSEWGYTYNDVETILAPRFDQVDILRANHHGSGHSTSAFYVQTLNPDVSAISCGSNSYGHPGQAVIDRLLGTGDLYVTNMCDPARNYGTAVIVGGDIIIRSTDGTNYSINGNPYVASDPSQPTPTPTATATWTATPTPSITPTPSNTPEPTATASATTLHVGDLDGAGTSQGGGKWTASVTITVHDNNHNPVVDATVSGNWGGEGGSGPGSCVTNASGQCTVQFTDISNGNKSISFAVGNLTHASLTYLATDNHDPDGDSDGTLITVNKP